MDPNDPSDLAGALGYGPAPGQDTPIIDPSVLGGQLPTDPAPADESPVDTNSPDFQNTPTPPTPPPGTGQVIGAPGQSVPIIGSPNTPLAPGQSSSSAAGVKNSGFSQANFNQIGKNQSRLDQQNAADRQDIQNEYAPYQAAIQKGSAAQQSAIDQETAATTARIAGEAVGKKQIADAQALHANQVEATWAQARSEAESIKGDYRAALRDYAAAQVNPAQLWDSAGSTGRAGFLATAFVHDFLGAKGIKTSAMDTFNNAVKNNIDAQLENIRKKKDVASGFKDLWDMQRSQSATDAEAKERVYGFHIQALSSQIESDMAKYDSPLAQAKGAAAKAALQQEMVKSELGVQQHIDAAANARAQQRTAVWDTQVKASMASAERNSRITEGQAKANAEHDKDLGARVIPDTTVSGGGKFIRVIRPGTSPEIISKVHDKNRVTSAAETSLDELAAFEKKTGDVNGVIPAYLQDEHKRLVLAAQSRAARAITMDENGTRASDQEFQQTLNRLPINTDLSNGSNLSVIYEELRAKRLETDKLLAEHSDPITNVRTPNSAGYGGEYFGQATDMSPATLGAVGERVRNDTIVEAVGDHNPKPTGSDRAVEAYSRPDAFKPASGTLTDELERSGGKTSQYSTKQDYDQFLAAHPEYRGGRNFAPGESLLDKADQKDNPESLYKEKPSAAFAGFDKLRHKAQEGDKLSLDKLNEWAQLAKNPADPGATDPLGKDPNSPESQQIQAIALWELSKLTDEGTSGGQGTSEAKYDFYNPTGK